MADAKGFLKYTRSTPPYRPAEERVRDYTDVVDAGSFTIEQTGEQAARCMGCGVPFCHQGCPLGNLIPEFNDAVHREDWEMASWLLHQTNNFPEFTGRICPAPCEHACVLGINQPSVSIEHIERSIADIAFERGYVTPKIPAFRTKKRVAVIGSGPAGLAAASQLNAAGHTVVVFERDERPGGLLRYGIPDFKLEKHLIDRRIDLMESEGILFKCGVNAGLDVRGEQLLDDFHAVLICAGVAQPRLLTIPGSDLPGVHFAMDYLTQSNRKVAGTIIPRHQSILARDKKILVIGGGDTGSDCVGTANRQGAASVAQLQYRPRPSETRPDDMPWPNVPLILTTSSSHEEGCERMWEVQTKSFVAGQDGRVSGLIVVDLTWDKDPQTGKYGFQEIPGSEREIPCDLALIAIGYSGMGVSPLWSQLGLELNDRRLLDSDDTHRTAREKVFVAGDARRGQSLVVWAIAEGRKAAAEIDKVLKS
jgi:glutamate synthase (NADPH/NADH) small chain